MKYTKVRYTLLHYWIDNAFSFLNRWRYCALLWIDRALARYRYQIDRALARYRYQQDVQTVETAYIGLLIGQLSADVYVTLTHRFYRDWGATWRK